MKINLVLGQQLVFPPIRGGGVENLNWMLAREFARRGHEVVAYSRAVPELPDRETDSHGIRHIRLPGFPLHPNLWLDHLNALRWAVRLWPVLEPADVTTFHTAFSFLLRYRPGLGVCTHTIHRTPKPIVPLYRTLDRVYAGGDAVVQQALAIDPSIRNLKRVWNCIDIAPDAQPPTREPRDPSTGLRFLYVGRFVPDKGIESLIKGFELALKRYPQNRLATVGPQTNETGADTAFFRRMSAYIADRHLGHSIELLPPIYDKAKLAAQVAAADVICVPSLTGETFSMAVLEGMAQAKPILVSDFGPMPEAIDHQVNGYVARAGDAASIGGAIEFFSAQRADLPRLGAAAFVKARDHFSAHVIAGEYLADFQALITARGTRLSSSSASSSSSSAFLPPDDGGPSPRPLRITVVQGAFLPVPPLLGGAVEKVWSSLGQEFARRGHHVTHISRQYAGLPHEELAAGVRHLRIPGFSTPPSLARLKFLDLLYSLRARSVLPEADILVTNTFWLPMLVRSETHGRLYVHVARYPRGQMRFYRHAARLQTVSHSVMEAIAAETGAPERVCTIPYPVLTPRPPVMPSFDQRARELLFVGRVHPEKGVHLVLEAFQLLPAALRAEWRLVIVGPHEVSAGGGGDDYRHRLETLARPLGDRVTLAGPVFDAQALATHFLRASLFVYPSLAEQGETFGLAPLEAMSAGCPVLVSDLACFREFIRADTDGFVFDHRATTPAAALAAKLATLLADPALLARIGAAALRKSEDYSLERIATRYLEDFTSLLPPEIRVR